MQDGPTAIPFIAALNQKGRDRLRLDDPEASARDIIKLAADERVLGFLYRDAGTHMDEHLAEIKTIALPAVLGRIAGDTQRRHRFAQLVGKLYSANIRVLLLKGIALSEYTYRACGLRPMTDIDFLVPETEVEAAAKILREAGLSASKKDLGTPRTWQHHTEWSAGSGESRFLLECHWHILPPQSRFSVDPSKIWQNAVRRELDGYPVWTLCPEHTLVHLCIHWHCEGYRTYLRDMFDLFAVASYSGELDWEWIAQLSKQWNAEAIVYLALTEMTRFFLIDEGLANRIAHLQPKGLLQKHVASRAIKRRIARNAMIRRKLADCGSGPQPPIGPTDMEHLALVISGRRIGDLLSLLLPSRQRLARYFGQKQTQISPVHYASYYKDCITRAMTAIMDLCGLRG